MCIRDRPGAVRRGGAVILFAARSRLHDAGDPGVSDGTGFGGVNRGQRFSALLCRVHADGGGYVHPDGDAAVRASRKLSSATLKRCAGTPASGLVTGTSDSDFDADDTGGRSGGIFSSASHVNGLLERLLVRHGFLHRFQR